MRLKTQKRDFKCLTVFLVYLHTSFQTLNIFKHTGGHIVDPYLIVTAYSDSHITLQTSALRIYNLYKSCQ